MLGERFQERKCWGKFPREGSVAERSVYLAVGVSPNDLESEPFQGQAGPGSGWQRPEQWLGAGSGEWGPFQESSCRDVGRAEVGLPWI